MDRRNLILAGVAGVLILVAIVYYVSRPSASAEFPDEIKTNCACLACRQHVRIEAKLTDVPPHECPECGQQAAYPIFLCRGCGKYFVPNLTPAEGGQPPGLPMIPTCSTCGSQDAGGYTGTETIPSDELVLPPWPQ